MNLIRGCNQSIILIAQSRVTFNLTYTITIVCIIEYLPNILCVYRTN